MKALGAGRFAAIGLSIASVAGALAMLAGAGVGGFPPRWIAIGWLLMAAIGWVCGVSMAASHGRPGNRFLGSLVVAMLARLFAAAGGAWFAVGAGGEAVWGYLTGIVAGYLPLQAFEMTWFLRKTRDAWPAGVRSGT